MKGKQEKEREKGRRRGVCTCIFERKNEQSRGTARKY